MEPIEDVEIQNIRPRKIKPKEKLLRLFLPKSHFKQTDPTLDDESNEDSDRSKRTLKERLDIKRFRTAVDPESSYYLAWLAFVSFIYVSNIFSITMRYTYLNESVKSVHDSDLKLYENKNLSNQTKFDNLNSTNQKNVLENKAEITYVWFLFDYLFDLVFIIDMFVIQARIKFLNEGIWVSELKQTSLFYFKSNRFIVNSNRS